jgi:hypothetical protein
MNGPTPIMFDMFNAVAGSSPSRRRGRRRCHGERSVQGARGTTASVAQAFRPAEPVGQAFRPAEYRA